MTLHPMELRARLQAAIDAADIDATELARRIGRSPEYIRDFLNGRKNSIKANELVAIEIELKTNAGHLTGFGVELPPEATKPILRGFKGIPPSSKASSSSDHDTQAKYASFQEALKQAYGDKMPIFSAEDNDGILIVDTAFIELVYRPWFLKEVRESFAVVIPSYNYEPVFNIGDLALINPRMPLVKARNVLLGCNKGVGLFDAQIVELVTWTKSAWTIKRLGASSEEEMDRGTWTSAYRVAGRVER